MLSRNQRTDEVQTTVVDQPELSSELFPFIQHQGDLGLRQVLNGRRWMQAERKFLGGTGWNGQGGKIQVN